MVLPFYDHAVGAFSEQELDRLERYCDGLPLDKGGLGQLPRGQSDFAIRSAWTAAIQGKQEALWFFERVAAMVRTLNERSFRFDLRGMYEAPQFLVYRDSERGHYDWHIDLGREAPRKLSLTIQLTDPARYEGCELEFNIGTGTVSTPKGRGVVVAFPSYMVHRVTPITAGVRKAIVVWITGPEFR